MRSQEAYSNTVFRIPGVTSLHPAYRESKEVNLRISDSEEELDDP